MSESPQVTVRNESGAYEAVVDGAVAGRLVYEQQDGRVALTHTVVDPAHRGEGIASVLAEHALDDFRAQGASITVVCPFVRSFIDEHPDYADLEA